MAQQLGSLEKVLRFGEGRRLKRLAEQAAYIGTLEPEFETALRRRAARQDGRVPAADRERRDVEELVFEAFAAVREAFKRTIGDQRLFDVQLMGGIVLHEGDIAEMKTGEGKTFVAVQPLYLNALTGKGVHLVTVNDYLAKRDAEWNRPVYEALGMTRRVHREHDAVRRARKALRRPTSPTGRTPSSASTTCATTWPSRSTASSSAATRTRSWTRSTRSSIDEARTPLIISGEPEVAAQVVLRLRARREGARSATPQPGDPKGPARTPGADFAFDEKFKTVSPMSTARSRRSSARCGSTTSTTRATCSSSTTSTRR